MRYDIEAINKRKKNVEIFRRIIGVILIILIYNIILIFISSDNFNIGINLFGYKSYIITSKSMEPSIHFGDVILVKKCKENKLNIGDIITFKNNNEVITHRILEIEKSEGKETLYITKGDNNNTEDIGKVTFSSIIGKSVLIIPYLGKIIMAIDNKLIFLIIILIILILVFMKIQKQEKIENRREKKRIENEKSRK